VAVSLFNIVPAGAKARTDWGRRMRKLLRRQFLCLATGTAAASVLSRVALTQSFPTQPIRLVVPFPPGGVFDFIGRPLADRLRPVLGNVFIENIGGGGGTLGAVTVAHARPDGYSVLLGGTTQYVTEALLKSQPQFNPINDLAPISNVAVTTFAIVVHPEVPAHSLNEFVSYAKASPSKVSYGSAGAGTLNHLTGESLKLAAGLPDLTHVPYRGAGPALTDLMGGQIPMIVPAMSRQVLEFHRAGKLRILAVVSPNRLVGTPELPTAVEQGFPSLVALQRIGLIAPAGTPEPIIGLVAQRTHMVLADREFQQMLIDAGVEPDPDSSPETFRRALVADIAHWSPIIEAIGLKID
jgi:tripartite-type tricarboxylate transporter receptor subunit TctC